MVELLSVKVGGMASSNNRFSLDFDNEEKKEDGENEVSSIES